MQIHPESGGPHAVPIDAQQCLGFNDAPMSEFWAWSWRHRVGDTNRFFVKQPASAAHAYGRKLVLAEGFTTIGPHWQETIWDNLKPSFDHALCEGLNLLVWHAFVCSPPEAGMPGIQYFAGAHLNPNSTWWSRSGPFFDYINRCQWMLQQGLFVADAAYYYGDHVPNFTQLNASTRQVLPATVRCRHRSRPHAWCGRPPRPLPGAAGPDNDLAAGVAEAARTGPSRRDDHRTPADPSRHVARLSPV
jgi:hypothetical protein